MLSKSLSSLTSGESDASSRKGDVAFKRGPFLKLATSRTDLRRHLQRRLVFTQRRTRISPSILEDQDLFPVLILPRGKRRFRISSKMSF
jgi:hypothetical protein